MKASVGRWIAYVGWDARATDERAKIEMYFACILNGVNKGIKWDKQMSVRTKDEGESEGQMDDEQNASQVFLKIPVCNGESPFKIPLGSPNSPEDPLHPSQKTNFDRGLDQPNQRLIKLRMYIARIQPQHSA